jgi:hypothetical protein
MKQTKLEHKTFKLLPRRDYLIRMGWLFGCACPVRSDDSIWASTPVDISCEVVAHAGAPG